MAAMSKEVSLLRPLFEDVREKRFPGGVCLCGGFCGSEVVVVQSGIGKVCAAAASVELIHFFQPDAIINTGAAGGLSPELAVMDVVAAEQTAYYDVFCGGEEGQVQDFPKYFDADAFLLEKVMENCVGLKKGLIVSGDRFVTSGDEAAKIRRLYPSALAVDMESAAVAQVCHLYQVPFLSLRVISDVPGAEGHIAQYENFWEKAGAESFETVRCLLKNLVEK